MTMKTWAYIVILFTFGLGSLVAMAVIAGLPSARPISLNPGSDADVNSIERLAVGVRTSLQESRSALEDGSRSVASLALDAAMRAADVGAHAATGELAVGLQSALDEAEMAARDLQNGREPRAISHLDTALESVGTLDAESESLETDPTVTGDYRGATLINAAGVEVGELQTLAVRDRYMEATVTVGGLPDMLGFVDVDGRTVTVNAEAFVFGESRSLGPTMVVVPSFETDPSLLVDILVGRRRAG